MENNSTTYIPEHEYADDLSRGLDEISFAVLSSGLTISAIAKATRTHWQTVQHAANRIPIRYDSYRRIMYFLKSVSQ